MITISNATKLALILTGISLLLADYVPQAKVTLAVGVITLAILLALGFSRDYATTTTTKEP